MLYLWTRPWLQTMQSTTANSRFVRPALRAASPSRRSESCGCKGNGPWSCEIRRVPRPTKRGNIEREASLQLTQQAAETGLDVLNEIWAKANEGMKHAWRRGIPNFCAVNSGQQI